MKTARILAAAVWCAMAWALTAAEEECGKVVTLAELIAHPDGYQGKALWVVAYVTTEFENMTACSSENDTAVEGCLWLTIDDGPFVTETDYSRYQSKLHIWEQYNRQTVAVHAMFDKSEKGHFSMWPGGLRNVLEVSGRQGGWNFISNTAIPRAACGSSHAGRHSHAAVIY